MNIRHEERTRSFSRFNYRVKERRNAGWSIDRHRLEELGCFREAFREKCDQVLTSNSVADVEFSWF